MKAILWLNHCIEIGGIENALLTLLEHLPPVKFKSDLLLLDARGPWLSRIPQHVTLLPPLHHMGFYSKALIQELHDQGLSQWAELREEIKKESRCMEERGEAQDAIYQWGWSKLRGTVPMYSGYDIAVAFSDTACLKLLVEKVDAGRKIAWIHNDYDNMPYTGINQGHYLAQVDDIVCATKHSAATLKKRYPTLSEKVPIHVLHNVIPVEVIRDKARAFFPSEYRADIANLATVGRLVPQKGIDRIIQTAKELLRRGVSFRWVIVGGPASKVESYQDSPEMQGLEQNVLFKGETSNPYPYIKHCDVYVQPSRHEARAITIEEAKVLGKPILATAYPSVMDSIQTEQNGLVCGSEPTAIANAIQRLLGDEILRQKLAFAAASEYNSDTNQLKPYIVLFDETPNGALAELSQ